MEGEVARQLVRGAAGTPPARGPRRCPAASSSTTGWRVEPRVVQHVGHGPGIGHHLVVDAEARCRRPSPAGASWPARTTTPRPSAAGPGAEAEGTAGGGIAAEATGRRRTAPSAVHGRPAWPSCGGASGVEQVDRRAAAGRRAVRPGRRPARAGRSNSWWWPSKMWLLITTVDHGGATRRRDVRRLEASGPPPARPSGGGHRRGRRSAPRPRPRRPRRPSRARSPRRPEVR